MAYKHLMLIKTQDYLAVLRILESLSSPGVQGVCKFGYQIWPGEEDCCKINERIGKRCHTPGMADNDDVPEESPDKGTKPVWTDHPDRGMKAFSYN